jgi:hypothetical protein
MSFFRRAVDVTFQLGVGDFGQAGYTTKTISGLRVQCHTEIAVGIGMARAQVRIYGMTKNDMLQLSSVIRLASGKLVTRFNRLLISAGNLPLSGPRQPLSKIFQGQITSAMIVLADQPNSIFEVSAHIGSFEASEMIDPTSYDGPTAAEQVLQTLAGKANPQYTFENNGCHEVLTDPYFVGSIRDQMTQCLRATKTFEWNGLDDGTLAIWPKGGFRAEAASGSNTTAAPTVEIHGATPPPQISVAAPLELPLISPATGMVGYPTTWNLAGTLVVTTEFNFDLKVGRRCKIQNAIDPETGQSELPFADGIYVMHVIEHDLESEMPDGAWFTTLHAIPWPAADIAPPPTP